jgi:hypothetical protein
MIGATQYPRERMNHRLIICAARDQASDPGMRRDDLFESPQALATGQLEIRKEQLEGFFMKTLESGLKHWSCFDLESDPRFSP